MAVEKIEIYEKTGVAKVILKPTKNYPNGYFYTDIEHIDIVNSYGWNLIKHHVNEVYVKVTTREEGMLYFHQVLAKKILGYHPSYIDHISLLELDNTDRNLNVVTSNQNSRNRVTKSYHLFPCGFRPQVHVNSQIIWDKFYKSEADAALATYYLRKSAYSDYDYDFFKDRRGDLDIVDLQYTGKISEEEATFRHVMRYAKDNAWYVYRYNLFDYFKENGVGIPDFSLDIEGHMIHPVTGQELCPCKPNRTFYDSTY